MIDLIQIVHFYETYLVIRVSLKKSFRKLTGLVIATIFEDNKTTITDKNKINTPRCKTRIFVGVYRISHVQF